MNKTIKKPMVMIFTQNEKLKEKVCFYRENYSYFQDIKAFDFELFKN